MRSLFRRGASAAAATAPAPARASVDVSLVRQRFNWDWCLDSDNGADEDTYWWYAVSIRVDPNEVIAADDEGNLYSVPFSTDGADEVTFGEPVRVRETFVPVAAADGAAATAVVSRRRQRVLASALERPDKPQPTTTAAERPDERTPMDESVRRALARQHGLDPETASEDDVNVAVMAASQEDHVEGSEEPNPPDAQPNPNPDPSVPPSEPAETPDTPQTQPEQAAAGERVVSVDRQAWEDAQRELAASAADRRARQVAELDAEADAAVRDGRITPASRDSWRAAIDPGENPDAAATARAARERETLKTLAGGRVPVSERGGTPVDETTNPGSLARALKASGLAQKRS